MNNVKILDDIDELKLLGITLEKGLSVGYSINELIPKCYYLIKNVLLLVDGKNYNKNDNLISLTLNDLSEDVYSPFITKYKDVIDELDYLKQKDFENLDSYNESELYSILNKSIIIFKSLINEYERFINNTFYDLYNTAKCN